MFIYNIISTSSVLFFLYSKYKNKGRKKNIKEKSNNTHRDENSWMRKDSDFILRNNEENSLLFALVDLSPQKYIHFEPNYMSIHNFKVPFGRRAFRRKIVKLCDKDFSMISEIDRLYWWYTFFPEFMTYWYLRISHWMVMKNCEKENPRLFKIFYSKMDDDINDIDNPRQWLDMWLFYFRGGTQQYILDLNLREEESRKNILQS